jgi:hypothetical protein
MGRAKRWIIFVGFDSHFTEARASVILKRKARRKVLGTSLLLRNSVFGVRAA